MFRVGQRVCVHPDIEGGFEGHFPATVHEVRTSTMTLVVRSDEHPEQDFLCTFLEAWPLPVSNRPEDIEEWLDA